MLFSEVYGSYFAVVSDILTEAAAGTLTERRMTQLVQEKAFAESGLSIPAALKSGDWPLLDENMKSVLRHAPSMPLTELQKRWLKSLLSDPRIALFAPSCAGLEDVEENERLKELLNLHDDRPEFVFESAKIVSRSTSNWERTFTISKGSVLN